MKFKYFCEIPACRGKGFGRKNELTRHNNEVHGIRPKTRAPVRDSDARVAAPKKQPPERACACGAVLGKHRLKCDACNVKAREAYNEHRRGNRPKRYCSCGSLLEKNKRKCPGCKAKAAAPKKARKRRERQCKCGAVLGRYEYKCPACKAIEEESKVDVSSERKCKCGAPIGYMKRKCDACLKSRRHG